MKKQADIVAKRKSDNLKRTKLCGTVKPFNPKTIPKSTVLFRYASDEEFLEIGKTPIGIAFIQKHLKKFKPFAKSFNAKNPSLEVDEILRGDALIKYTTEKTKSKSVQEAYRTKAMTLALSFFQLQIPVMVKLGCPITRISDIKTKTLVCDDHKSYTLRMDDIRDNASIIELIPQRGIRDDIVHYYWFEFCVDQQCIRINAGSLEIAKILTAKTLKHIVGEIMFAAGLCTIY